MAILRHIMRFLPHLASAFFSTVHGILGLAFLAQILLMPANVLGQCCQEVIISGGQLVPRCGTDTEAPQAPTGLNKITNTGSTIKIGWQRAIDNVAATSYRIFRNGNQLGTSTSLDFTDTGLQTNTTYNYTVKALDAASNLSPASSVFQAATGNDVTPPTAPTGLYSTWRDRTVIGLQWNAATDDIGVTGYRVFRNDVFVWTADTLYLNDYPLTPNTTYTYYVKAFDAAGNLSGASNTIIVTTLP